MVELRTGEIFSCLIGVLDMEDQLNGFLIVISEKYFFYRIFVIFV